MVPSDYGVGAIHATSPSPAVRAAGPPRATMELWRGLLEVRTAVDVAVRHGDVCWLVRLAELEREDDRAVDRDWEAAVAAAEHDRADDELGQRAECPGERVVGLDWWDGLARCPCDLT